MAPQLPDFLGLGTQKGGTTTLHWLLAQHQQVHLPECKEVQFFTQHHHQGEGWYRSHFEKASPLQRCGEITPFYLFHPEAPGRIQALLPQAKLIVLLRDPVERAISHYFHARKRGFEPLELEKAFAAEPSRLASGDPFSFQKHSYISRSRYLEQLDRYEALFPRHQLLILRSEDLFQHVEQIWPRLLEFLDLDPSVVPARLPQANAGQSEARSIDPRSAGSAAGAVERNRCRRLEPLRHCLGMGFGLSGTAVFRRGQPRCCSALPAAHARQPPSPVRR